MRLQENRVDPNHLLRPSQPADFIFHQSHPLPHPIQPIPSLGVSDSVGAFVQKTQKKTVRFTRKTDLIQIVFQSFSAAN